MSSQCLPSVTLCFQISSLPPPLWVNNVIYTKTSFPVSESCADFGETATYSSCIPQWGPPFSTRGYSSTSSTKIRMYWIPLNCTLRNTNCPLGENNCTLGEHKWLIQWIFMIFIINHSKKKPPPIPESICNHKVSSYLMLTAVFSLTLGSNPRVINRETQPGISTGEDAHSWVCLGSQGLRTKTMPRQSGSSLPALWPFPVNRKQIMFSTFLQRVEARRGRNCNIFSKVILKI